MIEIIVFYVLLPGLITIGFAAHNQYHVHPDDIPCLQPPCHTLEYFINNSDEYFMSDTTLFFGQGKYYHIKGNFTIQKVANFSLIGTPDTSDPISPVSVIKCLPEHLIFFYNVSNLLIKHLRFENCGSLVPDFSEHKPDAACTHHDYWAAIFIHYCTDTDIIHTYIHNPVGYGILTFNAMGNNSLESVTVAMGRTKHDGHKCSHGVQWMYESVHGNTKNYEETVILNINNIKLKSNCRACNCNYDAKMFEMTLKCFSVFVDIKNSFFSKWNGTENIMVYISSLSHVTVNFYNCTFNLNSLRNNLIDIQYSDKIPVEPNKYQPRIDLAFRETKFSHTQRHDDEKGPDLSLIRVRATSENLPLKINVNFNNVIFSHNPLALLKVSIVVPPAHMNQSSASITTNGYFVAEANSYQCQEIQLISIENGQLWFNGTTKFIDNSASQIIHMSSSSLIFSNHTIFDHNKCRDLIFLHCTRCYLMLSGSTTLTLSNNTVLNQLIHVPSQNNQPYPYCLFQYSSANGFKDFQIRIFYNKQFSSDSESLHDTVYRLTSNCRFASGSAFQNINPKVVNNKIVDFRYENSTDSHQLGDHNTICYCPPSSHYNCSVDQLGPVYPGENLTVNLCLPYNNEQTGVMYAQTNDNLPSSACLIEEHNNIRNVFHTTKGKSVNFLIASQQPVCELFLTAQPYLFTSYDIFHVHLLPCPLGFTLQNGICDCDPDLGKYIDDCMINSKTVKRLPNVYIQVISTGSVNSTRKYIVSLHCRIGYCLTGATRLNLHHPDSQCWHHRTGILCSQCKAGYSVIFGSNRCEKCPKVNPVFLVFFTLAGIFLVVLLFLLNFTVTSGIINGLILYANMIWILRFFFQFQGRLVPPLRSYIYTINLGPSFNMCFYRGLDMYSKMWIQITYPIYFLFIAFLFILGSRYSTKLYRLTYNRALPVLATLFMLTYTTVLQAIASAPLYTTIITVPGHSSKNLWLYDSSVPLFGWKLLFLISVSSLLFLILLMFNVILLFTKTLMRFKVIHRFKPLIDAFQGPFKSEYYYWIGIQLLIRNVMVLLSIFRNNVSNTISCIIIITMTTIQGYIQPYKSKLINIQELLLLYNFAILCVLLMFNENERVSTIKLNVMVGISFFHFLIVIIYHVFAFIITIHCTKVMKVLRSIKSLIERKSQCNNNCRVRNERFVRENQEFNCNIVNFQEPLIGED